MPIEQLVSFFGHDLKGTHLPFNFQLLQTAWNAASIAQIMEEYEAALPHGAWPNWVLGNHDKERIASKIGSAQARVAAMLALLTLRQAAADHLLRGGNWDEGCSHCPRAGSGPG